jgi:hypothetical protein
MLRERYDVVCSEAWKTKRACKKAMELGQPAKKGSPKKVRDPANA